MAEDSPEEEGNKRNAIITYAKVESLVVGIATLEAKLDGVSKTLSSMTTNHTDHEVRIRALELVAASAQGGRNSLTWLYAAIWPLAGVVIAGLNYLAR